MPNPPVSDARQAQRDFFWTLVRTDFKSRYEGTLLGFVWALMKPLFMFFVFYFVFSFIFPKRTYVFNLLIGLLLWDFFSSATKVGVYALSSKAFLLTKALFPRWILVVTSLANPLLTLLVWTITIVVVISIAHSVPPIWAILLFFVYLILLVLIVLGFALASSVLYLKYRDLDQIWDVTLQAGFFLAPIVYDISVLPERYHKLLFLWPLTPVLQFSRQVLIEHTAPTLKAHSLLVALTAAILLIGAVVFHKRAPRAVEQL